MPRSYPERCYERPRHWPKYDFTSHEEPPKPLFSAADQKELARLVAKYDRDPVANAAREILVHPRGRPSRNQPRPTSVSAPLRDGDAKELARLVRKYRRKVVADAAMEVPWPVGGRPPRDTLIFERMHLAQLIEEWAEEYRQGGVSRRKAVTNAIYELYEVRYGGGEGRHLLSFRKTTKKQLREGRRYWREYARRIHTNPFFETNPELTRMHFGGLLDWVQRYLNRPDQ